MALPQKVIEQLGREPAKTPGWSGRLLMFSSTIFFIVLGIYVGVAFGYTPYMEGEINKLKRDSETASQAVSEEDRAKIQVFHSQIANIKSLLDNHVTNLRFLEWLERNTQENVAFNRLELKVEGGRVTLGGAARSVQDAVDQARRFEGDPDVELVQFKNITASEKNGWLFDLTITFHEDFFKLASLPPPLPQENMDMGMPEFPDGSMPSDVPLDAPSDAPITP